eukprot:COSAG04_NODE_2193_length_4561_cov_46.389960_2_plen_226_part_00
MLTSDTPTPTRDVEDGNLWFRCQSANGEGHGLIPMEHTTELDDQEMVGLAFMENVQSLAREPAPAPAPAPVAAPAAAGQVTEHRRREFLNWAQTRGGLGSDEARSVLDRQIRLVGEGRSVTGDAIRDAEAHVRQLRSEREEQADGGGRWRRSPVSSRIASVPPAEARTETWPHIVRDGTQGTRVTTPCGRVSLDVPSYAAPGSTIQMMVTPTELAILQAAAAQRQ